MSDKVVKNFNLIQSFKRKSLGNLVQKRLYTEYKYRNAMATKSIIDAKRELIEKNSELRESKIDQISEKVLNFKKYLSDKKIAKLETQMTAMDSVIEGQINNLEYLLKDTMFNPKKSDSVDSLETLESVDEQLDEKVKDVKPDSLPAPKVRPYDPELDGVEPIEKINLKGGLQEIYFDRHEGFRNTLWNNTVEDDFNLSGLDFESFDKDSKEKDSDKEKDNSEMAE